jgi:hypothetical protein
LAPEAESALAGLLAAGHLDRLLIIAEPKAHKPYLLWGARNNVETLCEKPLTAVTGLASHGESRAWRLYADYLEVADSVRDSRVVLMSPRRMHEGYETVVRYLREFIDRFEVPVTYIENYHAEGVWNMPDEFGTRENHPYRYGYGKLLHSGYHHVDLSTRLASLNNALPGKAPDRLEAFAQATRPLDFFTQVDADRYRALLNADRFGPLLAQPPAAAAHLGETDVQVIGQFLRSDRVVTNLQLSLMHTSVNTRHWHTLPGDLRKNGRLPHERLTVHIGHLLTVEVSLRYSAAGEPETEPRNPFRIQVFRNTGVVGGEPFEQIHVGDGNGTHLAEAARREIVRRWLVGEPVDAELADHGDSVRVLSAIYASLARRREGRDGLVRLTLSPFVTAQNSTRLPPEPVWTSIPTR